jgi:hypothetical protein
MIAKPEAVTRTKWTLVGRAGACAIVLFCTSAMAIEEARQPPQSEPGVFGAIGKWVDDTLAGVTSGLGDARGALEEATGRASDTAKDATDAAMDTAGKVGRIPLTSLVSGRQRCVTAANKAPDCQAATDALCRDKGFTTGRSVDVQSAQKCPAQVWISGRAPTERECTTETYVTRAMCQ